ncbi:MAG TPA: CvpA family protein [Alphaproteobacteria bacterium]|nr:CvpA family protein [Alphaproteobacteria bacterium]
MNTTDIVVLAIIVVSGLLALLRGFVKEVLGMAGWIGAAFAALYLFPHVSPYVRKFIAIPWLADAVTGLGLFVVSLIILSAISHAIAARVHQSDFSALDKSLGLVFGLLRGIVVVCLAYIGLAWAVSSPDQFPSWIKEARTMPLVERGARVIEQLIPENVRLRSFEAMGAAEDKARQGLEAKRAFDQLAQPSPKAASGSKDHEGYKPDEIKEMNRLIQSNQ